MKGAVVALIALTACQVGTTAGLTVGPSSPGAVSWAVAHTVHLKESGCTGVQIDNGTLLTAKHCAPDDAKAGDEYEGGTLYYVSPVHDFVIVNVARNSSGTVRFRGAVLGEHLYVVGYPVQHGGEGQKLTVTDGVVAGPVDSDSQARITAPVYFGNSGGGVWADDGSLLGLAVAIYAADLPGQRPVPYAAQSFMVPVELIEPWI